MHNGAFATLESVIDFYDAGGGAGIGARLGHQTLPADSLHLSAGQKKSIVAFLRALSSGPM
jgi:cytochrome c peroxidase